ncbi:Structural maintenance of chromosomes protein 2 [Batrachochytrium dendrobatidis]|nr:Structural maintenance of chromosomes protein 2 [Batrachochytrium dendrobatidis]KAK5672898.1 Structural maintenance of chromosomes protein 2 [Batrachochytrium dendrobatidis]
MYLEELVLDGFKSYATRTVVGDWDPEFNAITGLNGSGKSNILDAICFVLGISTLAHVRASNLQDLVYKRGQAGVNKASVSVIFNNINKDTSPPGYHDHDKITITRQIIIGGRNKYLVNGVNKNQQDVANLFQSVQLNINNPNFLIMQGKITKVLNMKPQEILNMIEEAAGTRMFEEHKEKAIKTMDKKDTRLDNISNLLETEVSSKLDKLRQEKRVLLEYQKIDAELGQLQRFVVAYDYLHANEKVVELTNSIETMGQHIKHLETMNSYLSEDIHELDGKICEIMEEKQKNGSKNSELDKLIKELAKNLVKMTTQHNLKLETIEDEQKNKQTLIESLSEIEANIEESIKKEAKLSSECASTLEQNERHVANTRKLEELLQNLTTGVSSSSGQDGGYMDQLRAAKQQVSSSVSKAQQTQLKITHITNELQDAIPKAKVAERQNGNIVNDLKISEGVIKMLQEQICSIAFDPKEEENLLKSRQSQQIRLDELDEAINELESTMSKFQFSYSDPTPNFDRLKVKGLVAELINISKENLDSSTALEVCAGGKLYNVVVESEIVGTQLLQKGKLKHRVTIIPLNKITAFSVDKKFISRAKSLAPGKVQLALDLVGSDEELAVVMDYVFGSTLVCKDTATAKLVTFDNGVRLRSVTYDGDTYDPSGQLSGGSKSSSSGALLRMLRLKDLKKQRADVNALIAKINADLNQCLRTKEILGGLQQSLDLKTHEQNSLENRLKNNPGMQIVQHVAQLQKTLTELQESMADCARCKSDGEKSIVNIEKEIKELSSDRGSKLKSIQEKIAEGKRQILKAQPLVYKMQQDINVTKEETEQLRRDATQLQEQLKSIDELICSLVAECTQLEKLKISAEKEYQDGNAKLECEQSTHIICEKKLDLLQDEKRKKKQNIEDSKLELQTLVRDFSKLESEKSHFAHVATNLEKSHVWIQDKKKLFGKQDTEFDFQQHDMRECRKRLSQLNESHSKIQKSVDPQVLEKFDKVEKKETSLKQRLATVRKDRTKIQETIHTLDELKREKLIETWTKVNRDFGLIFGDLLPGNTCKLEASEGQDITEGLEIKVCLGGAWKQSLTELSGGQRSLIALSLILSLLQFKPAPMYILDEVDSALDLSHTQNIGQLLKSRFKGSQFIVVSLKDGMFNNANVLYRTKFVDGVSKVDRIASKEVRRVPLNATPGKLRTPAFLHTRRQSVLTEN